MVYKSIHCILLESSSCCLQPFRSDERAKKEYKRRSGTKMADGVTAFLAIQCHPPEIALEGLEMKQLNICNIIRGSLCLCLLQRSYDNGRGS